MGKTCGVAYGRDVTWRGVAWRGVWACGRDVAWRGVAYGRDVTSRWRISREALSIGMVGGQENRDSSH